MAYDQFTTVQLKSQFGLKVVEQANLFAAAPPVWMLQNIGIQDVETELIRNIQSK